GDMNLFAIIMIAIAILTGVVGYTAKMDTKSAEPSGKSEQHSQATVLLQSFGQLVHNPHLFKSSVLMLSASLIFGAVTTFIPLYASQIERG
ncbi:hypothetical protein SB761_29740, partial [Pseudomonas sp. SIMBA_064]